MKKIAIIGTNGIPSRYGGFETLAEYLSKYLSDQYDVSVYCSKENQRIETKNYNNSRLIYLPFRANGWQSMIYDAVSIFDAYIKSDVLIILGFSGVIAFPFKSLFNKKIVFNIGGIEWKKVRGNKTFAVIEVVVKKFFETVCVYYSDIIVVDNQVLFDYVKNKYNRGSVLVEYGGDHAVAEPITDEYIKKYPFLSKPYDVTVARAQEDMNIHLLIDAYKDMPMKNLVVVSNWNSSEYGKDIISKTRGRYSNIYLQDAVYDLPELNAIRSNARLYYHTHSLCGTAPSLTEAMYLGLAVICYDVDTNRATTEGKSIYFKDITALKKILIELSVDRVKEIGKDMKAIAVKRYTWGRIVDLYKTCVE
ncbi:glycosyltransferase family 1 protein [bacterium]|nr:glycosyltransferase family 1 protein [bacterium]